MLLDMEIIEVRTISGGKGKGGASEEQPPGRGEEILDLKGLFLAKGDWEEIGR